MNKLLALLLITVTMTIPVDVSAKTHRSAAVVRQFKKTHICPSTGTYSQHCKGYVVDHIIALCVGGSDAVWNMQYQSVVEAKAKDKIECNTA